MPKWGLTIKLVLYVNKRQLFDANLNTVSSRRHLQKIKIFENFLNVEQISVYSMRNKNDKL